MAGIEPAADQGQESQIWRVHVTVLPKEGVNDPEGEAILGGLRGLGFNRVRQARAGRVYAVELAAASDADAAAQAKEMAERLLANPVIQRFEIDRIERAGVEGS